MRRATAAALVLLVGAGCGFHLVGTGTSIDPRIEVIAVPIFDNRTNQDELQQILTEAVVNELLRRGRYTIVSDPSEADAVLEGTITEFAARDIELDEQGAASRAEVSIRVDLIFRNRLADRIAWSQDGFLFREEYEIPATAGEYLEQEILAVEELSGDFAASVVSSILEGF